MTYPNQGQQPGMMAPSHNAPELDTRNNVHEMGQGHVVHEMGTQHNVHEMAGAPGQQQPYVYPVPPPPGTHQQIHEVGTGHAVHEMGAEPKQGYYMNQYPAPQQQHMPQYGTPAPQYYAEAPQYGSGAPQYQNATPQHTQPAPVVAPPVPEPEKSTILGLRRRTFWIIFGIALVVLAVAIGGGVGGAKYEADGG